MIKDVLKKKLKSIGYFGETIEKHIDEINFNLIVSNDEMKEEDIEVITFENPDADIERAFLNIDSKYLSATVFDGEVEVKTVSLPTGGRLTVLDYYLDKRMCIVLITADMKIEIMLYSPDNDIIMRNAGQKYNDVYSKDRDGIIQDYLNEFISSNRLMQNKAREVMDMLAFDFVIDEMVIKDTIPVLKLYNNPDNFAEKITNYEFKYINRRLNRIEVAEKSALVKRKSKNIKIGYLSNDPYVKLNEANNYADFYLNSVSYFWLFSNEKGQEEIGIYTPANNMAGLYSNSNKNNDEKLDEKVREICAQFTNQLGFPVSESAIKEVILKLNYQLVVPPIDMILKYAENPNDPIEPLSYRYRAIVDPAEFESRLYNSIEDNMGRRYKFNVTENVLEDLTTIGNKLDYTNADGKSVKKQSIADFNQNGNAVIVRRETLIDESNIPDLLGYIYDDIEGHGTSALPVPSVEVDFYFASVGFSQDAIKMYNGTNYESIVGKVLEGNKFSAIDDVQNIYTSQAIAEGSTKVTIRYIASNGSLLRENKIGNVFPGDTFVPEILPIITDKDGCEWTFKVTTVPRVVLSDDENSNVIELEYVEKMADVTINFINTEGKPLTNSKHLTMQIGSEINRDNYLTVVDNEGIEWDFMHSIPAKFVVDEENEKNEVSLVYDVTRVDVLINYINTSGATLKDSISVKAIANKKFTAKIDGIIEDSEGKAWVYISNAAASIIPQENMQNVVNLVYDEMKSKVVTTFENIEGKKVLDDLVEFIQVGKQYIPRYENRIKDIDNKVWKFKSLNNNSITIKPEENENKIKVIYEPVNSKVTIKTLSNDGKILGRDLSEIMQVGTMYAAKDIERLRDINNKVWECKENKLIEVKEDENQNIVELAYEPLIVNVTTRFLDDESKEIIPSKVISMQAGDKFRPEIPQRLEDNSGKRWKAIENNEKEYEVKEQDEGNKISIYYEKVLTDITLSFKDLYSNVLLDDVTVQWQIGAEYTSKAYEKIKDKNNARWSMVSSDPRTMIVKEKYNHFTLIYDEIRTKVVIRYLNITNNTAIKEPEIVTAKLGVGYIPNIQREYTDPNRLSWTYVGEKELSIVTKEEEQDNIIVLKYEPHNAKVTVRYLDEKGDKIIDDNVKEMQVGGEVQIKGLEKIYSSNNLGYKLETMSNKVIRVSDDENKNVIDSIYVPLLGKIVTEYKNNDGVDIIKPLSKEQQVGTKYVAEVIDKVIDDSGKHWTYVGEQNISIDVKDEENTITLEYQPELKKVSTIYVGMDNEEVLPTTSDLIQVGEIYIPHYEEIVNDIDGKVWEFANIDKKEITVKEDEDNNIITIKHRPKLTDITISFVNDVGEQVRSNDNLKAQLGSVYNYQTAANIVDKNGLGWETNQTDNNFKVSEDNTKFVISYVPYLVNVYSKCVDGDNNEIIAPVVTKKQVGTKYEPEIKELLIDGDGREWIYVDENKLFGKSSAIRVSADETQNNALIKYKPSFADVTIIYVDPLGTNIKSNTTVKAQIGSIYSADVIERITDNRGNKWTFNPNTKNEVMVQKEGTTLTLSYEEQKAVVIYKYQDEYGNRLKAPKKGLAQVGMNFKPEIDSVIEDDQERVWEYKDRDLESIEIKDAEQDNVFVLTYVPLKVDVTLIIKDNIGNELMTPLNVKAQLGSDFRPNIDNNITDENSLLYKYKMIEPESIKVKENPIGSTENINKFTLTYEPVYSMVTIRYQDIDGNLLREAEQKQLQVGTLFTPKKHQYIKDKKENQWELVENEDVSIRVKESIKENTIKFVYEIAKADVIIRYKDTDGNMIQPEEKVNMQIGTEFVPSPSKYLFDSQNKKWGFFSSEPVKLKVGSINNIVTILYQEEKANVIVQYKNESGKTLKSDDRVLAQIGSVFKPKVTSKVIYDENDIWRFSHFSPKEIIVSENTSENIIAQIYSNNEIAGSDTSENIQAIENTDVPQQVKSNDEVKEEITTLEMESKHEIVEETPTEEQGYTYQNKQLAALDKILLLNDSEKMAIEQINQLNEKIINELNQITSTAELSSVIDSIFDEEKQIVNSGLEQVISNDKTGSKLLKILEISLAPSQGDKAVETLQQRKALAMTDYFLNKPLTDSDQALYICSKGKNDKQIELIKSSTSKNGITKEVQLQVLYEKLLLENYYRARSAVKDNYFIDSASREQLPQEVTTIVSNMIVAQTYNLLLKDNITLYQQIELKALGKLLNQLQRENLTQKINKISDGKQRKQVLKKLQSL